MDSKRRIEDEGGSFETDWRSWRGSILVIFLSRRDGRLDQQFVRKKTKMLGQFQMKDCSTTNGSSAKVRSKLDKSYSLSLCDESTPEAILGVFQG